MRPELRGTPQRLRRAAVPAWVAVVAVAAAACTPANSNGTSPVDRRTYAAPSIRGTVTATLEGGLFSLPVPEETEDGDLLVASIFALPSNDNLRVATPPGWTFIRNTLHNWIYIRAATGSEPPSYTWHWEEPGTKRTQGVMIAVADIDLDDPVQGHSGLYTNQDDVVNDPSSGVPVPDIAAPGVEAVTPNTLLLYFAGCHTRSIDRQQIGGITPPAGMTELADFRFKGVHEVAYELFAVPGPTGDRVGLSEGISIHSIATLIALRPIAT